MSAPSLLAWAPALAGITALIMLSAFVALRARGIANVIWLAAATAVIYAFVNAVTRSGVDLLMSRGAGVLATWEPYAPMAAGILSGLFGQSAFNAGPLSLSLPVIDTVEPVCSVILAAAVFHEHLARSLGLLAFQLAIAEIPPQASTDAATIARLLGLRAASGTGDPLVLGRPDAGSPHGITPAAGQRGADEIASPTLGPAPGTGEPPAGNLPILDAIGHRRVQATGWGPRSLSRASKTDLSVVPERAPLLSPRSSAATLQSMISTMIPDGALDVPAIVEMLARRQVPGLLPRHARATLRFGVQVLIDIALPMRLFQGDQLQLRDLAGTVAGAQLASAGYFADVPTRGTGPGPRRTWRPYRPPARGTRVLILSDFGLGAPPWYAYRGEPDEWRSFALDLKRQGCSAVGLLPVAAERWPSWLATLIPLICWDRTTTVSAVAAALQRPVITDGR